jgi:hypothetical protein
MQEETVTGEARSLVFPVDQQRFAELERVIERGFGTFVEVGRALLEIQERRLYRGAGHRTFADYVSKRWDLSIAHAYRQIDASKVVDILSPIGEIPLPANEAQARELAPLVGDPEAVRAVWSEAIEYGDGRITARAIRERVTARHPRRRSTDVSQVHGRPVGGSTTCPACGHTWSAYDAP